MRLAKHRQETSVFWRTAVALCTLVVYWSQTQVLVLMNLVCGCISCFLKRTPWRPGSNVATTILRHSHFSLLTQCCLAPLHDFRRRCGLFNSKLMYFSPDSTLKLQVSWSQLNRFIDYLSVVYWCWPVPHQLLVRSISGFYRLTCTIELLPDLILGWPTL